MKKWIVFILGFFSVITGIVALRRSSNFIIGLCFALFVIWLLLMLILIRRMIFRQMSTNGRGWMRTITILLITALVVGPLSIAFLYLWVKTANPNTDGKFTIAAVILVYILHCVGLGACAIAFLIQLWRDQWKKTLSTLAIAYQLFIFLFYAATFK